MSKQQPELLAAYWTLAGDVYPGAPSEISPYPLEARAAAAAQVGYTGMGLVHADIMATRERLGWAGMRQVLADHGIRHIDVEFLGDWFVPPQDPRRVASDQMRRDLLEAAGELGARNLKISPELFAPQAADIPVLRREFTTLCEQARTVGTHILMEMMPFTNVHTIDIALDVIAGADQPNGGLLLDIWHVARGGMGYDEIAKIPARFLKGIELDDADPQVVGTLFEDTRFSRRLCGEGCFNVPAFIQAVQATGCDVPYYGVEIISQTFRNLPLDVMAKTSYETAIQQFAKAR